ncbi:unnamed protein product [Lampetra planeri]
MDSAGSGGAGPRRSFRRACSAFFRRLASRLLQPTPPPWDDVNNQSPSPGPTPRPSPAPHQPPAPLPRAPQSHIDATRRRCGSPTQHPWQGQQAPQTVHDNIRVPGQHPRIHEDKNRGDNDYIRDPTQGQAVGPRAPPEGILVNTGWARTWEAAVPRGLEQHGAMGTVDSVDTVGEEGVRQQQPPVVEAEADYVVVLPAKPTDFNSNVTEMMRRRESPATSGTLTAAMDTTSEHFGWIERGYHRGTFGERRDGGDDTGRRELRGEVTCSEQGLDLGVLRMRRYSDLRYCSAKPPSASQDLIVHLTGGQSELKRRQSALRSTSERRVLGAAVPGGRLPFASSEARRSEESAKGEFLVHVRSERGAALRVAAGEHVLSVHAEGLTLLTLAERRALCTWPYTLTAKFGRATGVFSLVAGSRCESGPGLFSFETQDVNQVFDLVFRYIGLALPSTATPGPPCPRPPLDPQSPRGDGAEDSDDSSYDYAYCDVPEGAHAGT